jgi:hypothetical protein
MVAVARESIVQAFAGRQDARKLARPTVRL